MGAFPARCSALAVQGAFLAAALFGVGCEDSAGESPSDQSIGDSFADLDAMLDLGVAVDPDGAAGVDAGALDAVVDGSALDAEVDRGVCEVTASATVETSLIELVDPPGASAGDILVLEVDANCSPCPQRPCLPVTFSWQDLGGEGQFWEFLRNSEDPSEGGFNDDDSTPFALYHMNQLPTQLRLWVGLDGMGELVTQDFTFVLSQQGVLRRAE